MFLSRGRDRRVLPERVLGRSTFWWLDKFGVLRVSRDSRLGRWLRTRDPFPGRELDLGSLGRAGVSLRPRLTSANGNRATFADGRSDEVATVIWATGYRDESSWLHVPGSTNEDGGFRETSGVSPVAGLFFVERSWQRTRGSGLLLGVGQDAKFVVTAVEQTLFGRRTDAIAVSPGSRG